MQDNKFNKVFLEQLRRDCNASAVIKGQQYQDILFRKFSGSKTEASLLKKLLREKLSDGIIVERLISKLEDEDIPVSCRLLWFTDSLVKKLSSYARAESCTSQYYQPIRNVLKQFSGLVNSFQEKIQKRLDNKLKMLLVNKGNTENSVYFDAEDIDDTLRELEKYSDRIRNHYDYFNALLQRESDNCRGITVTSQVEQYLLQLVMFTEKIMIVTDATKSQLEKWQTQLVNLEAQEVYN